MNSHRDAYIAGLRDLADWLEANPDVTPDQKTTVTINLPSDDAVRAFAARHGIKSWAGACGELCWLRFGPVEIAVMSWAPDATERLVAATRRLGDL